MVGLLRPAKPYRTPNGCQWGLPPMARARRADGHATGPEPNAKASSSPVRSFSSLSGTVGLLRPFEPHRMPHRHRWKLPPMVQAQRADEHTTKPEINAGAGSAPARSFSSLSNTVGLLWSSERP